ncbi:MAG: TonB-dependent receptor [Desulfatitalea sp.]
MKRRWICLALALTLTTPAFADETMYKMEQLVVTASRIEEKKEDATTHLTIVSEEQIRQSPAQDLGDLLAEQGFMIREYPNALTAVSIRGFRTETHGNDLASHVLILLNGRRAGTGNLSEILVENVTRVEIVRGPGSVQYGASAMGGVINVITKQGKGKPTFFADQTLGSWDYKKSTVGGSGALGDFDFAFSGSLESQDDYTTAHGDRYLNTGYDQKKRASLNAGWTFLPGNRLGFIYNAYDADDIGSPSYFSQNDPDDHVDNHIQSFDVTYDGQTPGKLWLWNLQYFQGKDEYETFDPATYGDAPSYTRNTDHQGAQGQVSFNHRRVTVTTGMDWTHYDMRNTYATGDNTYDNPALFILAKTRWLDDRLILSAGGRHDWYAVEEDEGRSKDETNWASSFGVAYKLTQGLAVRANYAEAFRMPTTEELFMFDDYSAWGFGIWSGNPDLKPEKSNTWEAGLDFDKGPFSGGATYFYSTFDDYIQSGVELAPNLYTYRNVEGATIAGIEGALGFDIGTLLDWNWVVKPYVSGTYFTEYEDEQTGADLLYTPEWTAAYGIELANPAVGLAAKLNFAYIAEQDITDYEGTGDTTLDGSTVADLTISKELFSLAQHGKVLLKTDVRNLFDEDYAMVQGYPMAGRSFFVGIKYVY